MSRIIGRKKQSEEGAEPFGTRVHTIVYTHVFRIRDGHAGDPARSVAEALARGYV